MAKNLWVVFAVMILSVNFGCAGKVFKDPTTGLEIEMVYVKGGCYQMGNTFPENIEDYPTDELPVHEVCVNDFYLGKYEVTQGQWKKIMGSNPSEESSCGDNCPVANISWHDAQNFISRLNTGNGGSKYRLPTEAEFEYAQRSGGRNERYSGGNNVDRVAWYDKNSVDTSKTELFHKTHPVGTKASNGLGIYDMSGNVWEWTNDWYGSEYYSNSPRNNPAGPGSGDARVVRGGCASGTVANMRVSRRDSYAPDYSFRSIGIRLLRTCWNEAKGSCEP